MSGNETNMNIDFKKILSRACGAEEVFHIEDIQSLWSGYGKIMRYGIRGGDFDTVVIKHVKLPEKAKHPRGWNTDISHKRKVRSYNVETAWYRDWANMCDETCRVPRCLALEGAEDEFLMVFEDLDANGFPLRRSSATVEEMKSCLVWLANFHATFMGRKPKGLWTVGTYWHLETRPDELKVLEDTGLKSAAAGIDGKLSSARYRSLVHGDAKLANFCFSDKVSKVAAVDFQYVGGGCGMKDVAYFIGSCLYEEECEAYEAELLDFYFNELGKSLVERNTDVDPGAVEDEWRGLYDLAWTDFHRFIKGWSPGHWKINGYSERKAREVLESMSGLKGAI